MPAGFDILVLTASNEGQAAAYRSELRSRGLEGQSLVVPDPHSRRVGSGISTLVALAEIDALLRARGGTPGSAFEGQRVLIIHCGGDSRRLPAYAAHGKIFAPLPIETPDGRAPALLDLILADMGQIQLPGRGRVVIATGDVFLDLGAHPLGLERAGITGVAWASTPDRGSRHGVYICDEAGELTGFVHKPSRACAEQAGAVRPDGTVLVDTGVVALDPPAVEHWLRCAGLRVDGSLGPGPLLDASQGIGRALDLYGDMLPAMARRERLNGTDWRAGLGFRAAVVPTCAFLHIGSSRELLDGLTADPPADRRFCRRARARVPAGVPVPSSACVHNAVLESEAVSLGPRVVIESCHLRGPVRLEGSNILVGLSAGAEAPVELPRGWGLVCLPVESGGAGDWVGLVFGDGDDFKGSGERGGTFGNRPLLDWLAAAGLCPEDLWPGLRPEDCTLWTANLWVPGAVGDILESVGWMVRGARAPAAWRARRRWNAGEVMAAVDHGRLLEARGRVLDCV
ncbi:MAG: hypothetical protein IPJ41_17670 [Phycisphaerales bacterium]|nr:hypothetical protein [Phycisphaerales bacterium]